VSRYARNEQSRFRISFNREARGSNAHQIARKRAIFSARVYADPKENRTMVVSAITWRINSTGLHHANAKDVAIVNEAPFLPHHHALLRES